jgi:Anaerobic dehydrogenases, typically selenocysteine-containing
MPDGPFPEHYEPMDAYIANPLHPKVSSNPVVRVFAADAKSFGTPDKFPIVATSYRLAEHFHYWTKNVHDNAVLQPEMFVEMGERLAKAKGIKDGDWVEISSQRGAIKAKACVTKRIRRSWSTASPATWSACRSISASSDLRENRSRRNR